MCIRDRFLRRLENLLQSINDEQTQTLPQDELNRARLAWGMHTDDLSLIHISPAAC